MTSIRVFDPAMCCSTGICGPSVDPQLVRFAADLDWLKSLVHAGGIPTRAEVVRWVEALDRAEGP
jgi:hypothetical protein